MRTASTDWMDRPATPKLTQGDLMILTGLVTAEWSKMSKDPARKPYYETLTKLRQELIAADKSS